ncbi:Dyp-type peroxidase [Nonomuraea sp. NPDC050328]|uniref:Dyp-type peroxidase n=1 Tax=Nonomuraea sp. NPDC050328 TaxID=3364361 RepID=UPI0037962307
MAADRTTPPVSRRRLLGGLTLAGGAAAAGALTACSPAATSADPSALAASSPTPGARTAQAATSSTPSSPVTPAAGTEVVPFHGEHQAGVATLPQAHAAFVGLTLREGTDRDGLGRLLRVLTDDARRLTAGRPALADTEPGLAELPARLTVTFGFGPGLFRAAGLSTGPSPLPSFGIDRLQERWSGGDLLVQLCCDDPVTLAHALRMVVKDSRSFTTVKWIQRGFRQATRPAGVTQRNLMGQLDGTVNPVAGTPEFDRAVWIQEGPLRGGTMLVLRRIRMELDKWDAADSAAKEFAVGRRLDTGAPLTGAREHDEPDFGAVNALGFPVIAPEAHVRRARVADPGLRMWRRAYNYDEGGESGLLFAAYQADVERQFTAVQRRLAEVDLLNEWTTPIGSALFAIPPGCAEGGWIGESLLG